MSATIPPALPGVNDAAQVSAQIANRNELAFAHLCGVIWAIDHMMANPDSGEPRAYKAYQDAREFLESVRKGGAA